MFNNDCYFSLFWNIIKIILLLCLKYLDWVFILNVYYIIPKNILKEKNNYNKI